MFLQLLQAGDNTFGSCQLVEMLRASALSSITWGMSVTRKKSAEPAIMFRVWIND